MKSRLMILTVLSYVIVSGLTVFTFSATGQVGSFTRDDLIAYTSEWKGERLLDGRPKVSDDIIERMKIVPVTLAWSVLSGEGYESQYDGSEWTCIHPGEVLVGRALTVRYMPMRYLV